MKRLISYDNFYTGQINYNQHKPFYTRNFFSRVFKHLYGKITETEKRNKIINTDSD